MSAAAAYWANNPRLTLFLNQALVLPGHLRLGRLVRVAFMNIIARQPRSRIDLGFCPRLRPRLFHFRPRPRIGNIALIAAQPTGFKHIIAQLVVRNFCRAVEL